MKQLAVPVISVGNITAGGTGKTPFTLTLTQWLQSQGFRVGILTRGYGRKYKEPVVIDTDMEQSQASIKVGDEPCLMAERLRQGVIIVQKDRVAAGQTAIRNYGCDLLVLDDGFQYQRLARDLDLVLWDGYQVPATARLLPCGRLREPWQALQRATALIITRTVTSSPQLKSFFQQRFPDLIQFNSPLHITGVEHKSKQQSYAPERLHSKKILAFCGLGNPAQFYQTVRQLNPRGLITRTFGDHYRYSAQDVRGLCELAAQSECDYLLTTEKDYINLPVTPIIKNLLVLKITLQIDAALQKFILKNLNRDSGEQALS